MRRCGVVLAVAACAAVAAASAEAAAPRYILVTGPGLRAPVVLGDWAENGRFLSALVNAPRPVRFSRAGRPRYDLALFWGVPAKPVPTHPRDASQHAWFYPAVGARPAVVDVQVSGVQAPRVAPPRALAILRRHGVPTRAF